MHRAFSLIEILVVVAIIALLAGLGLYMSISTLHGTFRRSEAATIMSMLERARSHAMANIDESEWGFCYNDPNYEIFKSGSCGSNVIDTITANQNVATKSGFNSVNTLVVFSQLSGDLDPALSDPIQITVQEEDGRTSVIEINRAGMISS